MDDKLEEKRLSDQNDQQILKKKRALDEEEDLAKQKELDRNLHILQSQEGPKRKRQPSTKSIRKKENAPSVVKPSVEYPVGPHTYLHSLTRDLN